MATKRSVIILAGILITLLSLSVFILRDRALVYLIASSNGLDIKYSWISKYSATIRLNHLEVRQDKTGLGLNAEQADLTTGWRSVLSGDFRAKLTLNNVDFTNASLKNKGSLDSITNMINTPFTNQWTYSIIKADLSRTASGISVKDFHAEGDDIKLDLNVSLDANNMMEGDIRVFFSPNVLKRVPEELAKTALRDEDDGWKSLSVKLSGDAMSPSIVLTGSLFRLTIKTVQASK